MDARQNQLAELAARLLKLQQAVSEADGKPISDGDFARRFLPFSSTTLSRIKSETDPYTGSIDSIAEKVTHAEEDIAERLSAIRQASESERAFVATKLANATQASLKKARDSRGRRVVVLLAPTGAGKSAVGAALAARGAIYVEGRQSWKKSYKAFCADVAKAAGRPLKLRSFTEHDAEERMLQALRSRDSILYIDEANTLGPESANAIKLIVNMTRTVVLVAAIPEMWDKFTAGAADEVAQLINRCQPILRYRGLSEADARPFFAHCGISAGELDKCVQSIVDAANDFGAFKTIVNLVDELDRLESPTAEDVQTHLRFHAKNIAQSGITKGALK